MSNSDDESITERAETQFEPVNNENEQGNINILILTNS